jgi:hypothetical protein
MYPAGFGQASKSLVFKDPLSQTGPVRLEGRQMLNQEMGPDPRVDSGFLLSKSSNAAACLDIGANRNCPISNGFYIARFVRYH